MLESFDWSVFSNSQGSEKAKLARELAVEAEYVARGAFRPELRTGYLRLAKQLTAIADQIERGANSPDSSPYSQGKL